MYSLIIKNKEYNFPTDFTLDMWREIVRFDLRNENHWDIIISLVLDVPKEDVLLVPYETKKLLVSIITVMLYPTELPFIEEYKKCKYKDLSTLTFGEFVDLDVYFSEGVGKNIRQIITTLYGKEPDGDWLFSKVWGGIVKYKNFRDSIYLNYKNLFSSTGEVDVNDENLEKKVSDVKYTWYNITMVLAEGKFLNIDEVVNKPLISALNWLAWNKEEIEKKQDELQKRNK